MRISSHLVVRFVENVDSYNGAEVWFGPEVTQTILGRQWRRWLVCTRATIVLLGSKKRALFFVFFITKEIARWSYLEYVWLSQGGKQSNPNRVHPLCPFLLVCIDIATSKLCVHNNVHCFSDLYDRRRKLQTLANSNLLRIYDFFQGENFMRMSFE